MKETWGHLAPKRGKKYSLRLVFAVGCFGNDILNPIAITFESMALDSSPWFFDEMEEFMRSHEGREGCVYEFVGIFKNYEFTGETRLILDSNT